MRRKKTLKELTIRDNFMFGAVMSDTNNCRRLLELILDFPIERVEVSKERSIVYRPEYKGVRLDVYAQDENNTHYNVEMQAVSDPAIQKRTRYYHSQIDVELLLAGMEYENLPDSYVIFICDFDPFGRGKYQYTFEPVCKEDSTLSLDDGNHTIFLSTKGRNESEVSNGLVKFLKYVESGRYESSGDIQDDFVKRLQKAVENVVKNREMEGRYMLFKEMMDEEKAEGRAEGIAEDILDLLSDLGTISDELREKILVEKDFDTLRSYLKKAAAAKSIEEFESLIKK